MWKAFFLKLSLLSLLIANTPLFSEEILKIVNSEGKVIGELSVNEFKELTTAAKITHQIREAEKEDRFRILGKENIELSTEESLSLDIKLQWLDSKKKVIKEITLQRNYQIKKEPLGFFTKIRLWYRDAAEYAFPVTIVIILILA